MAPSYASSNVAAGNPDLIKLINEGTSTSSINYVSKDGSEINSTFTINNISYEMNESINLQEGIVASKVYLKEKNSLKYLGEITTNLILSNNKIIYKTFENIRLIDSNSVDFSNKRISQILNNDNNSNFNSYNQYSSSSKCPVEGKWSDKGWGNGSTAIKNLTVGSLAAVISVIANKPVSAVVQVANLIYQYHNDTLYYKTRTWECIERNPCSPIYPNWYPGGKYRYHTKFYADKYRKTFLYEVYGGEW